MLSIAGEDALIRLEDLARLCAAPQSILEQAMPRMRAAGLVRSERGPHGGYRLNKPPSDITLERVVRLFEGPLAPIPCATRHEPEHCPMAVGCSLRAVWESIRDSTIGVLEQTTFADLAASARGPWLDPALIDLGD